MSENNQHLSQVEDGDVTLLDDVKIELSDIDSSDLSEHAVRFEALHTKLIEAMSSIDGL